jgi:V8-like Glu-specific endopeptidase
MNRTTYLIAMAGLALGAAAAATADESSLLRFSSRPYLAESGVQVGEPRANDHPIEGDEAFAAAQPNGLVTRYATIIRNEGSQLMRVHFDAFELGDASEIHLMSLADGGWQRFTASSLAEWNGWSVIFNGDAILVELLAAPDEAVSFTIDQIAVNELPADSGDGGIATLCGTDNRVASTDQRVGRLSGVNCGGGGGCGGCTAWLTSIGSAMTAGHCGNGDGGLIEFNIPGSSANGMPVASSPDDQYPVGNSWYAFQSGGSGFDWAIMSVGPNSNTGLRAHWVQGYLNISPLIPADGASIRITGCGVDNTPSGSAPSTCCAWNDGVCTHFGCNASSLTLQTTTGPKTSDTTNTISYATDSEPANSGSPIISVSSGFAIGVHTHGGCTASGGSNSGTRLTQATLATWLGNFLGSDTRFLVPVTISSIQVGTALYPTRTLADGIAVTPVGGTLAIAGGSYPSGPDNIGVFTKAVTLTAVSGNVVIGN